MEGLHLGQSIAPRKPGDLEYFRSLCENEEGWHLSYDNDVRVYSRSFLGSNSKGIRVRGRVRGVNADTMFDFLCDDEYRTTWDTTVDNFFTISLLDRHTNLGYYCMKCPFPLHKRDVVFQRTWGRVSNGYIIMNHSVELPGHPPIPGIVRATSLITGYYMTDTEDGCAMTYLSHSDPKVAVPMWVCDKITTYIAPGLFRNICNLSTVYAEWKTEHRPEFKPWIREEQRRLEEYADSVALAEWGFPPPPLCLQKVEDSSSSSSDSESFHSLEGDETAHQLC